MDLKNREYQYKMTLEEDRVGREKFLTLYITGATVNTSFYSLPLNPIFLLNRFL